MPGEEPRGTGGRLCVCVCARARLLAQLCPTLCDLRDCSPPGSSVHGILQVRTLEWVVISSPGHLPDPGIEPPSCASPALVPAGKPLGGGWGSLISPFGLVRAPSSSLVGT